jgi:hypothetical protein
MELDPSRAGQIEVHKPHGIEIHPIPRGAWSVERVFEAHDLFEEEGGQYRVRVLRQLPDEPSIMTCVAMFLPDRETVKIGGAY